MQVTACEKESSKEFLLTGCHFFCWHVKILGVTILTLIRYDKATRRGKGSGIWVESGKISKKRGQKKGIPRSSWRRN